MNIVIDDADFDAAVRELAAATGEPENMSVKVAVQERRDRVTHRKGREMVSRLREIQERIQAMPQLDPRSADEIVGYNADGVFD